MLAYYAHENSTYPKIFQARLIFYLLIGPGSGLSPTAVSH